MDCFSLQALGDTSDSLLSETFSNDSNNVSTANSNDLNGENQAKQSDPKHRKEEYYNQYKNCLKLLSTKNYQEAEFNFKVLLQNLQEEPARNIQENEISQSESERLDEELKKLEYIIYKNLATIHTQTESYADALDSQIKAVKLDASDICLWYDIGENAIRLKRFQIARLAFEKSLSIDASYWPSLNNLIILLYALGNYPLCLEYTMKALKMDKFYMNGLIILKKIQMMNEEMFSKEIEHFIEQNYNMIGIDLDSYLRQTPADMYDNLMCIIDFVKENFKTERMRENEIEISYKPISLRIKPTWQSLGTFILDLIYSDKYGKDFNIHIPLTVNFMLTEKEPDEVLASSDETGNADKTQNSKSQAKSSLDASRTDGTSRSLKRKKPQDSSENDNWNKRRSLRKGNEKFDQSDQTLIVDIIRKYSDESYLNDIQVEDQIKKPEENTTKYHIKSLKENEHTSVSAFIKQIPNEFTIFWLVKAYLKEMSLLFDQIWYADLEDIFLKLYKILEEQVDLMDTLTNDQQTLNEYLGLSSTILVYLETQYSKLKEEQTKNSKKEPFHLKQEANVLNTDRSALILNSQLNQFGKYFSRFYEMNQSKMNDIADVKLKESVRTFIPRMLCLKLYIELHKQSELNCHDIIIKFLNEELEKSDPQVIVANSKLFQVINKERIKEFVKSNRKNKIYKLNQQINKLFNEKQFMQIVEELEEFAQNQKLSLDDVNFKSIIFIQFLRSYFGLESFEKCAYFCRKFLRQIVAHLTTTTDEHNKENNSKSKENEELFNLIGNILDIIHDLFLTGKYSSNERETHETIWLMYKLISIFFENAKYTFKCDFKPIKAFIIIYDLTCSNDEFEKFEYLSSVHDYLAKDGFCSNNKGEFLTWSIDVLLKCMKTCEMCNERVIIDSDSQNENTSDENLNDEANSQNTNTASNRNSIASFSSRPKLKRASGIKCGDCEECKDLLEQSFFCLLGYRKKTTKIVVSHSVIHVQRNLENCVELYNFFKPRLPEYDDTKPSSISAEFYELLCEIIKLVENNQDIEEMSSCSPIDNTEFYKCFETTHLDDNLINEYLSSHESQCTKAFEDIYYLVADYRFKIDRDHNTETQCYLIKDLITKRNRFDTWVDLALIKSSSLQENYLENGNNIITIEDLRSFIKDLNCNINLFRKSLENLRPTDRKIGIEYGLFLYQMHSYCSRQIKIDKFTKHFRDESIKKYLEIKKNEVLNLALEAYKTASKLKPERQIEEIPIDSSSNDEQSTQENSSSGGDRPGTNMNEKKNQNQSSKSANQDADDREEWFNQYMIGKIKEKLDANNLVACLEHYKKSIEYLNKKNPSYLKRINYKTNGRYSVELNEIFYRIYSLTLKRIHKTCENDEQMQFLKDFFEKLIETKFVKIHNDLNLNETIEFLESNVFAKSESIRKLPNNGILKRCVCICVAGLNQILKRFSQHYRSMYRIAHFYSNFLDFKNYEFSKNLLLSNSNWSNIPYMPCQGLLYDRNKTNYFNGIWKIPSDNDIERDGSFSHHLFGITKLLVETLEKSLDYVNLMELSKALSQKPEQDKKYLDDPQREYFAEYSLTTSFKVFEKISYGKFKQNFEDLNDLNNYQNELAPILLDAYELYKLIVRNNESLISKVQDLLVKLYVQFNPELLCNPTQIKIEDIIRFCQNMDKKEKPNKTKKPKVANPAQTSSQTQGHDQAPLPNISTNLLSFKEEH